MSLGWIAQQDQHSGCEANFDKSHCTLSIRYRMIATMEGGWIDLPENHRFSVPAMAVTYTASKPFHLVLLAHGSPRRNRIGICDRCRRDVLVASVRAYWSVMVCSADFWSKLLS